MSRDALDKLLREARAIRNTPGKVSILEAAVRLVDSAGDIEEGYRIRLDLVTAAIFSDMTDRAMVAFSWCLAQSDREPERFPTRDLIWKYKWMLGAATDFPTISLQRIRDMQKDFETRLKKQGHGLCSFHKLKMENAREMGYLAEGLHYEKLWKKSGRDFMADCRACEVDAELEACVRTGRYTQALRIAEPILSGELRCSGVPGHTYWKLIFARLALGEVQETAELFTVGYPLAARSDEFLIAVGWHLCYLTRVKDMQRGLGLVERHLPWAQKSGSPSKRMIFYSFAADFFHQFAESHPRPHKILIPQTLPVFRPSNRYSPAKLAAWFREQAGELAAQFDRRNGNEYVSWYLANGTSLALGLPHREYLERSTPDTLIEPASGKTKDDVRNTHIKPASKRAKRQSSQPAKKSGKAP